MWQRDTRGHHAESKLIYRCCNQVNNTQWNEELNFTFLLTVCFQSLEICILFQWITLQFINQKDAPKLELMTNDKCILTEVFNVIRLKLFNHFSFSYTSDKNNFPSLSFNFFPPFSLPPLFSTLTNARGLRERRKIGKNVKSFFCWLFMTQKHLKKKENADSCGWKKGL